jgi:hypothetical protein
MTLTSLGRLHHTSRIFQASLLRGSVACLWLTLTICLVAYYSPAKPASKTPDVSAYAPYWYIDDKTDSFLEINNHLSERLVVVPVLTLSTGKSVKLKPMTIEPRATKRLSLKSQPELTFRGKSGEGHWGDGSRANSLLGNARLVPVSPRGSTAEDFSAWILAEDEYERLGMVASMAEIPREAVSTALEGLWWIPYLDTQAYYVLQNSSSIAVNVEMRLVPRPNVVP